MDTLIVPTKQIITHNILYCWGNVVNRCIFFLKQNHFHRCDYLLFIELYSCGWQRILASGTWKSTRSFAVFYVITQFGVEIHQILEREITCRYSSGEIEHVEAMTHVCSFARKSLTHKNYYSHVSLVERSIDVKTVDCVWDCFSKFDRECIRLVSVTEKFHLRSEKVFWLHA